MIKYFSILILLISLCACEEQVPSYDTLTPDEQTYINQRSEMLCRSNEEAAFSSFITTSNDEMSNFTRGKYWKVELTKNSGGSTVQSTDYIYVWKVDGTTVYFLYQQKDGSGFDYFFYKITQDFNNDMIRDLLDKKCTKTYSLTTSSSLITLTRNNIASSEPPTNFSSNYTYKTKSVLPAFFNLYNFIQLKKTLNSSNVVTSSETWTYTISYVGVKNDLPTSFTSYDANYCLFNYDDDGVEKDLTFPYTDTCVTAITGPTNPGLDGTLNFNPAIELVIP